MIEKSDNITNLAAALLKAQKAIGIAIKNEKNPYFKSNYADLKAVIEAVKDPLNENGISFLQAVNVKDNSELPVIETMLLHESGQFINSVTPVFCSKPNDPQAFGSGVTYSKRYALQAILGLPTADDDGEKAMARGEKPKTEPPKVDIAELVNSTVEAYIQDHEKDVADGFYIVPVKVKEILREAYKKLTKAKQKSFDAKAMAEMLTKVKLEDTLGEVPA